MSNENKEAAAAPEGAEQQTGQQPEAAASKATKAKSEPKPKAKAKTEAESVAGALKSVGLAACKRHELAEVWVTSDGQVFPQEGDAKAHALNLGDKVILKVTPK